MFFVSFVSISILLLIEIINDWWLPPSNSGVHLRIADVWVLFWICKFDGASGTAKKLWNQNGQHFINCMIIFAYLQASEIFHATIDQQYY